MTGQLKIIWFCSGIIIAGLFAGNATASPGDRLSVTVKRANVRAGPSTRHPVVYQLQRGSKVIELQRNEDWIEVESKDTNPKSVWIHATLLRKDTAAEQLINSNATISSDPLFDLFMQAFNQYQSKLKTNTGMTYFARVENPGNRVIQLTITNDWLNLSRPERDAQLTEIFNIWNAAVGDDVPITVDIIDPDGTRLLSKFK